LTIVTGDIVEFAETGANLWPLGPRPYGPDEYEMPKTKALRCRRDQ